MEHNLVRSNDFPSTITEAELRLAGARVILCTLSMLSNSRMQAAGFTRLVPVDTVIIDEASQIEIGDYIPLLHNYGTSLRKLVCSLDSGTVWAR
ncbi:hypothetical protein OE88DRAFT_1661505 [Heliocybe sulcata]|uniref:DNA2/NAM7 helicase helicase domain-containing protein n=1 Tax=Heliocybe sulcata TaxID=5364 RepID=A0A5C3MYL9_9AGAM|nr:hypothetical protein OE88DRAFT_1661505 [Heliocybe sulcata]